MKPGLTMRVAGPETTYQLTVVARTVEADGVVRLVLADPRGGELLHWEPGAHVDLILGDDMVRQYSLCGDPENRKQLEVAVLRERSGRGGSAFVHEGLGVGSSVGVRGPRNHFALVDAQQYLFIAGGIGITPLLPMIMAADRAGSDWRLLYGGRTRASMAFVSKLEERYPNRVSIFPEDETGLIPLAEFLSVPRVGVPVYSCGPEQLLVAVESYCAQWPMDALHVERFVPRILEGVHDDVPFVVELASSGETLEVPAWRSLLDVLNEAGFEVPSSCREGTCGTCEVGVLGGEPDHRDSVLSESERAAGDLVMTCVSRCKTSALVLDL